MLIVSYVLLMLTVGRCTDDLNYETVGVGQLKTLTCPRQTSPLHRSEFYWIRLVSGNMPEFLGGTFHFDYVGVNKTPHITTKQGPGAFLLDINEAKLSDTGAYYCLKVETLQMTFLTGIFLRVKGPEPDITAVIQHFPPDPVHPGDSVTLQCSVLSDSENKTCPGEHSVFWFRAGSDESHPSLIYAHGNNREGCEKSPETHSAQKCVYSLSQTVSSSDAGTYYCAVATCGEILFGSGTKLDIEAHLQTTNTAVVLLCAALALSLIVIATLIYTIKMKTCDCCNAATAGSDQQSQQRNEDSLVYSVATFTKRKTGRAERRNGETIYTAVRA